MSLRGLWVILNTGLDKGLNPVIFSRRFSTVERRASILQFHSHVDLPLDLDLCNAILDELGHKKPQSNEEFNPKHDSCMKAQSKPVYEVLLKNGRILWPVVILEKFGLVFACVPLVEQDISAQRPPLIELPGVTVGYSMLHSVADFVGSWTTKEQLLSKARDLHSFLSVGCPFGTPLDVNPTTVQALIQGKDIASTQKGKIPAWKPVLHKGKQQLVFTIREEIKAAQHGTDSSTDAVQLFGIIMCKADLEGIPEITASIISPALKFLIVHPSVQEGDTYFQDSSTESGPLGPGSAGRRVRFRPPLESFPLCHYSGMVSGLPIEGIYQMRGDAKVVQISLQLKLNAKVKNSFDYCEAHLPFFKRGLIMRVESAGPSSGTLVITPEKRRLVWNIGQKFPKSLETTVSATVYFGDVEAISQNAPEAGGFIEDPFCEGINSYVQVFFKLSYFTMTGCVVDPRSLNIYPSSKFKFITSSEFSTGDYKIWNTHGDAMIGAKVPEVHSL
ncbi:AP-5 complex subunit mu-1 isoform X2 [Nematostella vectensis]|uniref:AP-5 complex subunit mu-1 isoform X2 n=1 Tax=Nematostella vectensis TaxID=45351 RepID=UPI0013905A9F|nr:AP-5 complex subunit mu-1 isoform X2 [Nematostella vectensis]